MPESQAVRHPGKVLEVEFLLARGVSQYRVAVDTGVPPRRINEIVHGKRGITADTALRLARFFDNDPLYWMQLQARWDLQRVQERLGPLLDAEVRRPPPSPPASPTARRRPPARRMAAPAQEEPSPTPPHKLADHLL